MNVEILRLVVDGVLKSLYFTGSRITQTENSIQFLTEDIYHHKNMRP